MKMDEKFVKPVEISIKQKKSVFKGQIVRAAVFARCKVVEVVTSNSVSFYLMFYKDSPVYGDEVEKVSEGSFIEKAFQKGIVFESPHPILSRILPHYSVTIPTKKKVFSQLQDHYSLEEIAYIATCLDSFLIKEQLTDIIYKIFNEFKRNGSDFKAFQVIRMLKELVPDSSAAQDRFNLLEFHSYREIYTSNLPSIQKKDPLYFEQYCFENRSKSNECTLLKSELEEQNRLFESWLVWIEEAEKQQTAQSAQSIDKYTNIALQFVSFSEWIWILSQANVNPLKELSGTKPFLQEQLENNRYEEVATLLLKFIDDLPGNFDSIWNLLWSHLDAKFVADHLDDLLPALEQYAATDNRKQFNQLLLHLATYLFKENDLKTVQHKLIPVKKIFPHSPVIRKIDDMLEMSEDPERMMQLGKHFAEFEQFDDAIECFYWEMEFHPEDASPVWHLSKMYQRKGMVSEAEAYQKYFAELKKQA
jgi:tetratricopeptide (TPR) repeat protein